MMTCVFLVSLPIKEVCAGRLYSFVDKQGVVHFTNVPSDPRYTSYPYVSSKKTPRDLTAFEEIISHAASQYGLDPDLIKAIIHTESGGIPDIRSSKGAIGLMQLMPDTASNLAVSDPSDPNTNIWAGTRYLSQLLKEFRGDLILALAAYNAGPKTVKQYGGIPPYPETREYLRKVLRQWQRYRHK
ncbi:MAG: transglycosylase SLT domain-containing protein [Nitrospiraceae bacterium]|nr:transglycosylase SLT domain-containing protein [Nitrospiraceae bacterium]